MGKHLLLIWPETGYSFTNIQWFVCVCVFVDPQNCFWDFTFKRIIMPM